MSLDEIEEQYGQDKADKLRVAAEYGNTMGQDSVEYEETRYGDTYNCEILVNPLLLTRRKQTNV